MSVDKITTKRNKEKAVITFMVELYCYKKHHKQNLCPDCRDLLQYAHKRIDLCPYMESKTFCSNCSVHCYQKEKREQIRNVMRYSGLRMLLYRPGMAIAHIYYARKERK